MRVSKTLQLCTALALMLAASTSFGQVGQLGGGTGGGDTGGTGGGGPGTGADSGSTTEDTGGLTTDGPGGAAREGGTAGGNIADFFVGGNNAEGFVGGGIATELNAARQFSNFFNTDVPTGGNRETSGTPRRVASTLKIAFNYPRSDATTLLIGQRGPAIQQLSVMKPEFRSIKVSVGPKGLATLTGSVPNAASRRLAANIVRLRPGVRKVDNKLAIATALPTLTR